MVSGISLAIGWKFGELNSGKYCLAIDAETMQKP
jgi:hypothetical protein